MLSLRAYLGLDGSGFARGLNKARSEAQHFGKDFAREMAASFAAAFGTAAIVESMKRTLEYAHNLENLSKRLGVTTTALQEFEEAAREGGSSLDAVATFFAHLNKAREEAVGGNEQLLQQFSRFGIELSNLKTDKVEDLFRKIAEGVQHGDVQSLSAALQEIGGRGATDLIPAFVNGLDEAAKHIREIGGLLGEDVVKTLAEANKKVDELKLRLRALAAEQTSLLVRAGNWVVDDELRRMQQRKIVAQGALSLAKELRKGKKADIRLMHDIVFGKGGAQPEGEPFKGDFSEANTGAPDVITKALPDTITPTRFRQNAIQTTALQGIGAAVYAEPTLSEVKKIAGYTQQMNQSLKTIVQESQRHVEPELE